MQKSILKRGICASLLLALCLWRAGEAWGGNGLNLIGFGAESYIMGGADLAVARDTTAMNTNPAGLVEIERRRIDLYAALGFPLDFRHQDRLGNNESIPNNPAKLANFGYAHRLMDGRLAFGIGLFAQGGSAVEYNNLITPFGNRDDLSIAFRVARVTPSAAFRIGDSLSVGASVLVTYADFRQRFFPHTSFFDSSDPARSFFGSEIRDMNTLGVGLKAGALYRVNDKVRVGVAYTSRVGLNFEQGELISDMTALGLGRVAYRDVTAGGIDQPAEFGVGLALEPTERLLLSFEVNWIDWSKAVKRSSLEARDPDHPAAPPLLRVSQEQGWRDQYVAALGVAYAWTERLLLRAGYNYGRNPIPSSTINPLLAPIGEHHFTLGGGYRVHPQWRIDGGVEYDLKNEVTYTNPSLPFGEGAKVSYELIGVHLALSRIF